MANTLTQRYVVAITKPSATWKWNSIFSEDSFPKGVKLGLIKWKPGAGGNILSINDKVASGITGNIVEKAVAGNTTEITYTINAFKKPVLDFGASTFTATNIVEFEFIFPVDKRDFGKKIPKHKLP